MKRTNILWITALLLGLFFDFLFWKQPHGLNFAIYALLCLGGGILVLELNGFRPSWRALLLFLPILFFAAITFIRQEPLSLFLGFAFSLGLMALLAVTWLGGGWPWYGLWDYISRFAVLVGSLIARPLMFLSDRKKQTPELDPQVTAERTHSGWKRFWAVLRGVLIAIPVVAVFAALLSSADLVFAQRLQDFIRLFRLEKLPEYILRAAFILAAAYALAGAFLHAAQKSQDERTPGTEKPLVPQFLGFTEAAVVLGAVVLLFALFGIIQFRYFFGGQTNIGISGYTYSEYARRGFGELAAVALFSLLLFLGLNAIVRRQNIAQRWAFSGLGVCMVALVGVMLVSAFQRLLLYEGAYGFTRPRLYTHVFMIWLGVLLAGVVLLELLRRKRFFPLAALLASIGFAATLTLVNVDASIVGYNVERAEVGQPLDVPYLASLSSDAIPALVQAFQSPALSPATHDAVAAALVCQTYVTPARSETNWRLFTLSRSLADAALKPVQANLKQYKLQADFWPVAVTSPQGKRFDCYSLAFAD